MKILDVKDLSYRYKSGFGLENINFSIDSGECISLVGPNGAGKSTLIKCLYNYYNFKGEILIDNLDLKSNETKVKAYLGIVPQDNLLDYSLNVYENLYVHGICFKINKVKLNKKIDEALGIVNLLDKRKSKINALSGGMKRRVVLARALISNPKLIILDEPTVGLDIESKIDFWNIIKILKDKGVSIMLTSHETSEIVKFSDTIYFIKKGQIIEKYDNKIAKINEEEIVNKYFKLFSKENSNG